MGRRSAISNEDSQENQTYSCNVLFVCQQYDIIHLKIQINLNVIILIIRETLFSTFHFLNNNLIFLFVNFTTLAHIKSLVYFFTIIFQNLFDLFHVLKMGVKSMILKNALKYLKKRYSKIG